MCVETVEHKLVIILRYKYEVREPERKLIKDLEQLVEVEKTRASCVYVIFHNLVSSTKRKE